MPLMHGHPRHISFLSIAGLLGVTVALATLTSTLFCGVAFAATWTPQTSGTTWDLQAVAFTDDQVGWAVGGNGTILHTANGGSTWTPQTSGTTWDLQAVAFADDQVGWAVGGNGTILHTANGGSAWGAQTSGTIDALHAVSFTSAATGRAVGSYGTILSCACDAPTVAVTGAGSGWHTSSVDLTVTATVDPSLTLGSLEYTTDGGSSWTDVPGTGLTRTLTISAEGTTDVEVRATDSEGQTATGSATVRIDSETPTISVSGNDDAWHAMPVTLTFVPAAGPSGVASVEYKLNDGSWTTLEKAEGAYTLSVSAEGETTVSYRCASGAGLISSVGSCTVKIDTTAPTVVISGAGSGWQRGTVTLTVTATVPGHYTLTALEYSTDGGATWADVPGSGDTRTLTISGNGSTDVEVRVRDSAGQTATCSATVKIDNVKPKAKAKKATWKRGKPDKLRLYVTKNPAGCGRAKVKVRIYKGKKLRRSFATKYLTVNKWQTVKVSKKTAKRLAKGKYTIKLIAVDRIGNTQAKATKAKLRVK